MPRPPPILGAISPTHESPITNHDSSLFHTPQTFHISAALAPRNSRAYSSSMARPDCATCGGTGWKIVERNTANAQPLASADSARPGAAIGEPKMVWAVPCECTLGDRSDRLLARARVPERYRHCDFDNFETDNDYGEIAPTRVQAWNRNLVQGRIAVEGFAREYPLCQDRGLLLIGNCGVGKTHLAVAALKAIVLRGHSGLFYDYRELLKQIQDSYNAESQATEMTVLEPVLETDILVLDDLGSSKPSPWAVETVGHILNTRYNGSKFTIVTTNYLDPEMRGPRNGGSSVTFPSGETRKEFREDTLEDRIGTRIRSRLYEMCRTMEISAPDYRKEIRNLSRGAS
jgi:DNA replication protein DnaC